MNTKIISNHALSIIDQYSNFCVGTATCSVPYFNNKTQKIRAGFRVQIGKGSPKEIYDEVLSIIFKAHIDQNLLKNDQLKKIMVDNNIGIDCSAFLFYVINAESIERKKGQIDKKIKFVNCKGIINKLRCHIRPIENSDVMTFANNSNTNIIEPKDTQPGDIITIINSSRDDDRDHVMVIHEVTYQNYVPTKIKYSHAIAYPEDGIYGSGIKQGTIDILDIKKPIEEQEWNEGDAEFGQNKLQIRAKKATTQIRRMKWFD